MADVAGAEPAPGEGVRGGGRIVPVLAEEARAAQHDLSLAVRCQIPPGVVDDTRRAVNCRLTAGTDLAVGVLPRQADGDRSALAQAVDLSDRNAALVPRPDCRFGNRRQINYDAITLANFVSL